MLLLVLFSVGRPRYQYPACRICGVTREEVGHITGTGRCPSCSAAIAEANIRQLKNHDGPFFLHWRRRIAASVGASLIDES